ncbi:MULTISPECIES: Rossmann-like domain-containing protein [Pseudonocardia]|uniref:Putative heavy-metal chelation domain-containing protein n=2 Tax=Pseudonocardia TaxID=1847 RepID=A0A1Y2MX66_PSEAH|nr:MULTISPECIES: DUF364 domain-containing protein [Pseudonocardia]OSY39238.1 hypothetical protein BG845_03508 [Pseudonocardia autotrophica]TDN76540.1 putative heavy-metal chelation protein [Pseudonocardia autotrophica]BBG00540.1 hypothetical protein Pdca_17490 [Pseudonocardia autotrophica]GEC26500.1 hypothetical protein PSA01_35290 [Pseudonocardia saturnea]
MSRAVADLLDEALTGGGDPLPDGDTATSVFWLGHGTRLAGGPVTYRNHYVLVRCGRAFGAASVRAGELDPVACQDLSGLPLAELMAPGQPYPVRIAALDARLAAARPFATDPAAERVELPAGTPETRALARDAAVAGLLDVPAGARVALIGVVNPLVAAIRERGAQCLPCDLDLRRTQWDDPVSDSADEVIDAADAVVATGMTLANGTFDRIVARCGERGVPLTVYAQTGAAVARAFLGDGIAALSAEPFPFSQFSADATALYRYRTGR